MNLLELTYDQLLTEFGQRYAKGAFHAAALYRAFYTDAACDPTMLPAFAASPALARRVRADLATTRPVIVDQCSQEGVTKLLFRLADGEAVETVVVPMTRHTTVCISCQVGCRMGCRLCETGRMGLRRSLSAAEIVAQVHAVRVDLGLSVRNVVFMGMGEPLDNFDNVVQAIRVLEDQRGLAIAKRRITVSTCGRVDGIRRLAALNWPQLKLAVSLNAADDETRNEVMPVNRQYNLATLKQALGDYPLARGNVLLMEYVVIAGINDREADAGRLADYLEGLSVRLNLIVYNPRRESPYAAPAPERLQRFHQALVDRGVFVRLRRSKGAGIQAACGQLGAACRNASGASR
jgi:23S rRNA (adenine2503-C2)-methyltransferase